MLYEDRFNSEKRVMRGQIYVREACYEMTDLIQRSSLIQGHI